MSLIPENESAEQKAAIDELNAFGEAVSDGAMNRFIVQGFPNISRLLRARFPVHSLEELTNRLGARYGTFIVMGSGPSIPEVLKRLPPNPGAILCGPTALGALLAQGITPTALVVADADQQQYLHVLESRLDHPQLLDIVLPIQADPIWYSEKSVIDRERLFFYLPYQDFKGMVNTEFNYILKSLFPNIRYYVTQAGSVSALALNVADIACGDDPAKRVCMAVDCCWRKGGPRRAPLRYEPYCYGSEMNVWWKGNQFDNRPIIDLKHDDIDVQTDIISLTYMTQVLWQIHANLKNKPEYRERYSWISPSADLLLAVASPTDFPMLDPEAVGQTVVGPENWAYTTLAKLTRELVALKKRLQGDSK